MEFRQAVMQDLPQLKAVYKAIIQDMNARQIQIWDDIFPCEFFAGDIQSGQLYVLYDNLRLVSAFALCDTNSGENAVKWQNNNGKALYLNRFGVNIKDTRKGIGSLMLTKARETAKSLGAVSLRLFVVDINRPAIRLYEKNGFTRAGGTYDEIIEDDFILREYGYETKLL